MPAVHIFALFSGQALLIDFFLQISCFVALMALDAKRQESDACEIVCCVKAPPKTEERANSSMLYDFFSKFYAPTLMKDQVRAGIVSFQRV